MIRNIMYVFTACMLLCSCSSSDEPTQEDITLLPVEKRIERLHDQMTNAATKQYGDKISNDYPVLFSDPFEKELINDRVFINHSFFFYGDHNGKQVLKSSSRDYGVSKDYSKIISEGMETVTIPF